MEILFYAVVAALVLGRLYQVLGQNRGAEPPPLQERHKHPLARDNAEPVAKRDGEIGDVTVGEAPGEPVVAVDNSALGLGLAEIRGRDRSFNPESFIEGARTAYEMIVTAYGRGDAATLRDLVSDEVFEAYQAAIAERAAAGAPQIQVVRISDVSLKAASITGTIASIDVHFSADLQDGGDGLRPTDEVWTFERDTLSRKPDWVMTAVEAA